MEHRLNYDIPEQVWDVPCLAQLTVLLLKVVCNIPKSVCSKYFIGLVVSYQFK